jgi:hypothetical protein
MSSSILAEQFRFLSQGGIYQAGLAKMRDAGILPLEGHYVFKEYPKRLRMDERVVEMPTVVEYCDGTKKSVVERRTIWTEVEVNSEDEEERVLSGGKTSAQIEDERLGLLQRCRNMGIPADPAWTAVRLRRELGDALDAPAPGDEMAKLEAELTNLRKMAAMREEIAMLQARLSAPTDEREDIRAELDALGVPYDKRWAVARLREELEAATAPSEA